MSGPEEEWARGLDSQGPEVGECLRPWCCGPCTAGKEFPDMGQNERRIKFNRLGKPNSGLVQGRAKPFRRLVANFYSLKTEKIPTGMVALGDWLGCYGVGILSTTGSGNWSV